MTRERDEFVSIMTRELSSMSYGEAVSFARAMMRASATLHRLAERECNGTDWEYGMLVPCPKADPNSYNRQGVYIGPAVQGWCPECGETNGHGRITASQAKIARTEARVTKTCAKYGITPHFSGDPRGAVLVLTVQSGYVNDWGRTGVCVPTR